MKAKFFTATVPFSYIEPGGLPGQSAEEYKTMIVDIAYNAQRYLRPQPGIQEYLLRFAAVYIDAGKLPVLW